MPGDASLCSRRWDFFGVVMWVALVAGAGGFCFRQAGEDRAGKSWVARHGSLIVASLFVGRVRVALVLNHFLGDRPDPALRALSLVAVFGLKPLRSNGLGTYRCRSRIASCIGPA